MNEFYGLYFDGRTSRPLPVKAVWDEGVLTLREEGDRPVLCVPSGGVTVTPPLGKSRRSIRFSDGGLLETDDGDAVRKLERLLGRNRGMRFVHYLESQWKAVACCVVGLLLCFWVFHAWGIPYIAMKIAYAIPAGSLDRVSRDALKVMDSRFFGPSTLSSEKALRVERVFHTVRGDVGEGYDVRLIMRKGKAVGANAFALPSGTIVVSDELVALATDDRALAGVLAHEIAHVKGRHAIRQFLQSAGVFFMISVLTGDIASISSTAASIPMLLVQTGYSRDFEKEADREAALHALRKGWGTEPYVKTLKSLHKGEKQSVFIPLLSTHPTLNERIKYIEGLKSPARQ